ncbi:MAG: tRNA lysidine(34) synthetase TilS [Aquificae bacterium]|nr:tRNA lysidine(34) synthetase TilS [Aquificota bacterium]
MVEKKFLKAIKDFNLVSKGDRILVAFSGGVDSTVLANLLLKYQDSLGIEKIGIAHLNHTLREGESDRDEAFSKSFAREKGLPFFSKKIDIKRTAEEKGLSVEEAAREERYAFLKEIAEKEGYNRIATGHHLTDLTETMLLWFVQGNRKGIKGFKPAEGLVIRPLYYLTKEEIKDYAAKEGIKFVEDRTNLSTDIPRNLIRHEVIPVLKRVNPSLENSMLTEAFLLQMDDQFLEEEAGKVSQNFQGESVKLEELKALPPALAYRVIIRWIYSNTGIYPSYRKVLEVLKLLEKSGEKRLSLGGGFTLVKSYGRLYIKKEEDGKKGYSYKIEPGQEIFIKEVGLKLKCYTVSGKDFDKEKLKKENRVVCFDLQGEEKPVFTVRSRREGDRFVPFGHKSEKKLKDVLIDLKVPRYMRDTIPIVEFRDKILWVAGWKRSAHYPITENTEEMICFEIKEV